MGCYATRAPAEVAALPNVTEVLTDKRELPDLLGRFGVTDVPTGITGFGRRHRAYVKVQDGCLLRCSFCIIPHVRPELSSRPKQHILDEVRRLVDNGYREIVLTGIHLGHYGVERNGGLPRESWQRLANLVREICQLPGEFRVRLSSIEATEVTRPLLETMAAYAARRIGGGGRLANVTRHMGGLFHGLPGARRYRQILSTEATRPDASADVLASGRVLRKPSRAAIASFVFLASERA